MDRLKAWFVKIGDDTGNWLIHAETLSKAKMIARRYTDISDWDAEYIDLRTNRCKSLDGKPFTLENAAAVLFFPDDVDEDGHKYTGEYCTRQDYRNQCPCDICKEA